MTSTTVAKKHFNWPMVLTWIMDYIMLYGFVHFFFTYFANENFTPMAGMLGK